MESFPVDGLQQIINCLNVERADRVLIVRGHENHEWLVRRCCRAKHLEAVEPGHLHVEENEVGPLLANSANCFAPAPGFSDDVDLRLLREHRQQSPASQWFVVDDECPKRFSHPTG
jgi:hypothetical protein